MKLSDTILKLSVKTLYDSFACVLVCYVENWQLVELRLLQMGAKITDRVEDMATNLALKKQSFPHWLS